MGQLFLASKNARTSGFVEACISFTVPLATILRFESMAILSLTRNALSMSWVTTIDVQRNPAKLERAPWLG